MFTTRTSFEAGVQEPFSESHLLVKGSTLHSVRDFRVKTKIKQGKIYKLRSQKARNGAIHGAEITIGQVRRMCLNDRQGSICKKV
jgi:hypothetical protein